MANANRVHRRLGRTSLHCVLHRSIDDRYRPVHARRPSCQNKKTSGCVGRFWGEPGRVVGLGLNVGCPPSTRAEKSPDWKGSERKCGLPDSQIWDGFGMGGGWMDGMRRLPPPGVFRRTPLGPEPSFLGISRLLVARIDFRVSKLIRIPHPIVGGGLLPGTRGGAVETTALVVAVVSGFISVMFVGTKIRIPPRPSRVESSWICRRNTGDREARTIV